MAHELDITNGVASFVSARQHAWHRLGTVLDDVMTAEEALQAAHLANWNVRKMPLYIPGEPQITDDGVTEGPRIEVPDRFATVRTNPITGSTDYLGVVGAGYTVIQNEQNAELVNALVDESGAHFETAGGLNGGRRTFLSMKLPESIALRGHDGPDVTDMYIVALNSHDGTCAFRFIITPVRVVCANTERAAIAGAVSSFSFRHTSGATGAIAEAREKLGLTFKYQEAFQTEAQKMIDKSIREQDARIVLKKVYKFEKAETDRQKKGREEVMDKVIQLWKESPTIENIRGSRWGLYNAVTEYADHFSPTWGDADPAQQRAERTVRGGELDVTKEKAFALLTV
ncbi:DUF932 domain-containing protein [Rhodococcus koreensis]